MLTLHVDNGNFINVISTKGIEITKLIVRYCTSGNIIPFGIESFDNNVRKAIKKVGTPDQALKAISIVSELGSEIGSDGLYMFLPGINLIYGLPGQTRATHDINMEYLKKILERGLYTGRLFFMRMTHPTGVSFTDGPTSNSEYLNWFNEIISTFVLPMQERVYPRGSMIRNNREVVLKNGDSYLRTLGTCPIRIMVKGKKLEHYGYHNVRIKNNLGYRLLEGELTEQTD